MFGNLTGWHFVILLAIVLLIFGAAKLPALARSVGQSARILKTELKSGAEKDSPASDSVPHESATVVEPVDTLTKH